MTQEDDKSLESQQAAALSYDGYGSPRVVAKGEAELAQEILRIAHENGVPIRKDQALTALLSQVDIGTEIPPLLYVAVAEALAFAYSLQDELRWVDEKPGS
ncbi:EscU/YscU/HrcU family type III secretion system export apparatus switch protein [Litorivivens sp.]